MDQYLSMTNISKSFSQVQVLYGMNLDVREGEIHALIGENGAGKSTLMKILIGVYSCDGGEIKIKGQKMTFHSPRDSFAAGISMIHQELLPILDMTVAENIFVGKEIRKFGIVNKEEQNRRASEMLKALGVDIAPDRMMRTLSISEMQMVEIAKNISFGAKLVIMDEPTSAITESEVEKLFKAIRLMKSKGISVIYISHRLEELFEISDRITVLRDGHHIATMNTKETDKDTLISMMVGRQITDVYPESTNVPGEVCLEVKNLSRKGDFENVSFALKKGERLGIAGLMGSGRSELVQTIFGERKATSGTITLSGKQVSIKRPGDAIKHKIALITEDRKKFGLNLLATSRDNLTSIIEPDLCHKGFFDGKKANSKAIEMIDRLNIKVSSPKQIVGSLSGGNQQKIVLGKWLLCDIDIFIFDEPTRGIDVGAKNEIYKLINQLAAQDKGIIIISSEMPELMGLSDRIVVLHEGRLQGELEKDQITQENIMRLASGI